jgi:hypothetical protein
MITKFVSMIFQVKSRSSSLPFWKQAIEEKKNDGAGVFTTNEELKEAVNEYYRCKYQRYSVELAEKLAREYGWVIVRQPDCETG